MEVFFTEFIKDYSTYTFSYVPYVVFRSQDEISGIYREGFLPYTGKINIDYHLYYKARSVRVDLEKFESGSENRRVNRKFESLNVTVDWIPIEVFNIEDGEFLRFCTDYSRQRFKGGEMKMDRLLFILRSPFLTDIVHFKVDGKRAGYVLIAQNDEIVHYWYSFYELEEFHDFPLGKFMMLAIIQQSKLMNRRYCYLGTCYGTQSLYKVRDFKGVEYSDGSHWSDDIKQLRLWCQNDNDTLMTDRFKAMATGEANAYIHSLLSKEGQ